MDSVFESVEDDVSDIVDEDVGEMSIMVVEEVEEVDVGVGEVRVANFAFFAELSE